AWVGVHCFEERIAGLGVFEIFERGHARSVSFRSLRVRGKSAISAALVGNGKRDAEFFADLFTGSRDNVGKLGFRGIARDAAEAFAGLGVNEANVPEDFVGASGADNHISAVDSVAAAVLVEAAEKIGRRFLGHCAGRLRLPEAAHLAGSDIANGLHVEGGAEIGAELVTPGVVGWVTGNIFEAEHGDRTRFAPGKNIGIENANGDAESGDKYRGDGSSDKALEFAARPRKDRNDFADQRFFQIHYGGEA